MLRKRLIAGICMIALLVFAGVELTMSHQAAVQEDNTTAQVVTAMNPDVAYVSDDFTLPPPETNKPVYDKYTLAQRKEKGLPLTYGTTREYYYGDHMVYLTFDDGPNDNNTTEILDILKKENIHATFFLTGQNVKCFPNVVKQIYASGNAIGIHSYSHDYKKIYVSPETYTDELVRTEQLIYDAIHVRPIISRAPGGTQGHFTPQFWQAINDIGYIEVGWNALTGDADGTGNTVDAEVENIRQQLASRPYLQSHFVILMHDAYGHHTTVEALPKIIQLLKDQGYSFGVITPAIPPSW